jgi:hypothetical protein
MHVEKEKFIQEVSRKTEQRPGSKWGMSTYMDLREMGKDSGS